LPRVISLWSVGGWRGGRIKLALGWGLDLRWVACCDIGCLGQR
jgi:hypothetical protein